MNFSPDNPVEPGLIERMNGVIAHRGPDDEGFFRDRNVALGHRRLSIIDLGGGHQPIFNEDGSVAIVFNGEIYNYASLTRELVERGHQFRTRSDTEAIVHAWEEYGPACVERMRGMFAFAIWDGRQQRLFLARDRVGKKPLYYFQGDGFFAFASEIKALLEIPGVPREVDREALDLYLSLRYVPAPLTMFRGIRKLEPGHWLMLEGGRVRTERFWDIRYLPVERTFGQAVDEFRHLLEESVRLRLMSEVPLGVFLSGGLDSSTILAVMTRQLGCERVKTFSVGYESASASEEESNEFDYARMAAKAFGAEHHEYRLNAADFRDFLPGLVWHLDEPMADPSCVPLYFISRLARQHVTVILSGEGADEILAGYGIYQKMLAIERLRRLPGGAQLAAMASSFAPGEKIRKYLAMAGMPLEARYRGVSSGLSRPQKDSLLGKSAGDADPLDKLYERVFARVPEAGPLDRMLYADAHIWLPDDLLLKADKMTMAAALELRVPFLDQELVQFAATLPASYKLRGSTGKYLLREAMRGIVPEPILTRSKKGFPVPTAPWLAGRLKDFPRECLLDRDSGCRQFTDPRALEALVSEHEQGRVRHEQMWTLLVFEFWHRMFMQRSVAPTRPRPSRMAEVA